MRKRQSATWQEVEKEAVLLQKLLERLSAEDRLAASIRICFEVANWAGNSLPESIGILESAKWEYIKTYEKIMNEEGGDED